jgi:uncharacterized membrane protein YfcA
MNPTLVQLLCGLAVGISLGITGGGGSIITVPLLVYIVHQHVHAAIPTSLVIVGATAFAGYLRRLDTARTMDGIIVGLVGVVGAVPGRLAADFFSGRTLLLLFALLMIVAAVFMYASRTYEPKPGTKPHWAMVGLVGIGIGFLTGFLGVGGGFLIVPGLVLLLGLPMREAIPTSLLVIALNCASGLLGPVVVGHGGAAVGAIDWHVALLFVIGGIAGAAAGSAVVGRLNQKALKHVFAVFVFAVGVFVAGSATGVIPVSVK